MPLSASLTVKNTKPGASNPLIPSLEESTPLPAYTIRGGLHILDQYPSNAQGKAKDRPFPSNARAQ
uniref:Uncharacterized protein n=1 Tax=Picea sitchensis TaxID=3332 RepID=A0A6B9XS68_PICSI|nr:hypothetical protein Q903MT_gene3860 [Picea sitchensis]